MSEQTKTTAGKNHSPGRRFTPAQKLSMVMQRLSGASLTEISIANNTSNSTTHAIVGSYPKAATGPAFDDAIQRLKVELLDEIGAEIAREALWVALLQDVRSGQLAGQTEETQRP